MASQSILARLGVVMTVNSAEFKKGLDDATIQSRAFQAQIKRQNAESAKSYAEVSAAISKMGIVAAVAGAAILKAFSYADEIQDTADSLDLTVESLIRMRNALAASGGETENMGRLLTKLVVAQQKARDGTDSVRDAFSKLGVAGSEVEKLAPDELFKRVAEQLKQIEDPAKRNAMAFELLGKSAKGVDWKAYWENYGKGKGTSKDVADAIMAGANAWDNLKLAGTKALEAILVLAKPLADLINRIANSLQNSKDPNEAFNKSKSKLENDPAYLAASLAKRREMIEQNMRETALYEQRMAEKGGATTTSAKKIATGGYAKSSDKEKAMREERDTIAEVFKIRVQQLNKTDELLQREKELIGLSEFDKEVKKISWALEDEHKKFVLETEKEINIEKKKGDEADQIKLRMLQNNIEAYKILTQISKEQAIQDLEKKQTQIRMTQVLTDEERKYVGQMIDGLAMVAQKSRGAFAVWKAMSIAMAIIDTFKGAQAAYTSTAQIPVVGPYLAPVAAAVAIATGMARVQAIRQQEYAGRARGGSIVANTPYMVGEEGPELVIPNKGATVIPNNQLSNHIGGSGTTFNGPYIANMSAIDTQSALQFISRNKEAIWSANVSASRSLPASR